MVDEDAMRMAVLSENLDEVDYYALLEIAKTATSEQVRDGFHSFALRFHPDQHVGDPIAQKRGLAIFKRGAEAYRVLMQPTLRARYDDALASGGTRLPPESMRPPADDAADDVPASARGFYDKAVELLAKGNYGSAKMHLALAAARGDSPAFDALARKIAAASGKG